MSNLLSLLKTVQLGFGLVSLCVWSACQAGRLSFWQFFTVVTEVYNKFSLKSSSNSSLSLKSWLAKTATKSKTELDADQKRLDSFLCARLSNENQMKIKRKLWNIHGSADEPHKW